MYLESASCHGDYGARKMSITATGIIEMIEIDNRSFRLKYSTIRNRTHRKQGRNLDKFTYIKIGTDSAGPADPGSGL
jgi:hypothetical protein